MVCGVLCVMCVYKWLCGVYVHVVLCVGVVWCVVVVWCDVWVLCWCCVGVGWCVSFLSFFSFFSQLSSLSLSFSFFFSFSFQTLCKEPINQQTSRRSDVIWRTLVRG